MSITRVRILGPANWVANRLEQSSTSFADNGYTATYSICQTMQRCNLSLYPWFELEATGITDPSRVTCTCIVSASSDEHLFDMNGSALLDQSFVECSTLFLFTAGGFAVNKPYLCCFCIRGQILSLLSSTRFSHRQLDWHGTGELFECSLIEPFKLWFRSTARPRQVNPGID